MLRFLLIPWFALAVSGLGGTLTGHVRDQNWFARYQTEPYGVGYYEYGVNANGAQIASLGGSDDTGIFGEFSMPNLPAGEYTVASWDVWWRSAFAFNVQVPASGATPDIDLRLHATMWGYPTFWEETGFHEFGQTFVATGPLTMIYLRAPFSTNYTLTIREGGPNGPRVAGSPDRTFNSGDVRVIYGWGEMPTVAGQTYYVRIRTSAPTTGGVLAQMDPRPDFSDPMPGGMLFLGNGTNLTPHPGRDLGLVIMSDDDGVLTNLHTRDSGQSFNGTSVGQTFVARGVNLISAAFWVADPSAPTYVVRVFQSGPGGAAVGTTKRGKPPRLGADPEMIVTWNPGECPLVPGQTYYVEVTREGGAAFNSVYANNNNPFAHGQAFRNGAAQTGFDLAGTLMEEQSAGSATRPSVRFTTDPVIMEADRAADQVTIRWTTDVPAESEVHYAENAPPYTKSVLGTELVTNHVVTLRNLAPHTLHHFQATSRATTRRDGVFRDQVVCTRNLAPNLLANPGFETGSGNSPRPINGWTASGSLDLKASNGSWFSGLPPHSGGWLAQGSLNGSLSDAVLFQRVTNIAPAQRHTFSVWCTTWPRENNAFKYDVWQDRARLIYMQIGIDPAGGTNPLAASVQWTPRFYSHLHWTPVAHSAISTGTALTAFVRMKGEGVQWHLYGIDDAILSAEGAVPAPTLNVTRQGQFALLDWIGPAATLETSTTLSGSWSAVTSAVSPRTVPLDQPAQFFRLRTNVGN
ncbi:MAG: hypothetical protein ACR2OZ_12555 [Verrucomicrobiales bacterium]